MFPRGYTTSGVNLWPGGVVEYNFVSDGSDSLKDAAFYVDDKVTMILIMSRFMIMTPLMGIMPRLATTSSSWASL